MMFKLFYDYLKFKYLSYIAFLVFLVRKRGNNIDKFCNIFCTKPDPL